MGHRRGEGWLSRLFGCVPAAEREGVELQGPCWELSGPRDASAFFRALADLVPPGSILFIEVVYRAADIRAYLSERSAARTTRVAMGTIWPRPAVFHMEITPENLEGLASLADQHAEPELADHLHVYHGDAVVVQWYDAFSAPLFVSKDTPEEKVREFCVRLGISCRERENWRVRT